MIPAAERIEALRERNPGAVELATAISLAVRADPELLRHARLAVGADATAEADLWWSDLVTAQNADGIMLEPAAAEALRARLAERPELLDASWSLISAQHASEHTAVRLEELVNWLSVAGGDEAADRIEELLIAGAREWMTTAAEPAGGVRWVASALRRLPRTAAASPAGAALGAAAATHLGRTPELDRLPADAYDNWFPWLLARLKTASLRVALIDGGLEFEGESGETFDAPDTDPVLLTVAWGTSTRDITVRRGERTTVALDADEVELTTIAGRRFTLRRRGAQTAGLDFSAVRAAHRPAFGLEAVVNEVRERVPRGGWGAIAGPRGSGTTTALCAALDALEAEGTIVLQHFYGHGPGWWDEHTTVMTSLVAQLRAASPDLPDGPLHELLRAAPARSIVVALDNPPPRGYEELKRWLFESSFPSLTPGRSTFIVAGEYAAAVRDWLEDGDPYWRIEINRLDLSGDYVRARWPELMRAFGGNVTFADPAASSWLGERVQALGYTVGNGVGVAAVTDAAPPPVEFVRRQRANGHPFVVVGDNVPFDRAQALLGELSPEEFIAGPELLGERLMALTWPGVEPLVTQPIARLRRIVDWIVTQRPGSLTISALPASLMGTIPWSELEPTDHRLLGLIAAGFPDLTLGDVLWTLPPQEWPSVMDALGRLQRLHLIDGTPFPVASDPATQIDLAGHRSLASRDPNLADELDAAAVAAAHESLVPSGRIGVPPEYFARHEVAHAHASGQPTAINAVQHVAALTQRVHRLGLGAVAADAPPMLAEAIGALAARHVGAADFPAQLYHELCMRIGPRAAGAYLHPNAALRPLLTAWDATVAEREEGFTEVAELLPFGVALTSGEIRPFVGTAFLAPGSRFIALREQMVAAIGPQGITAASAEGQFSLETPGEITWAAAAGDGLLATTDDGTLLHWPQLVPQARRLLGHGGPVTAVAIDERGPFVEVSGGGERVGYGVFVGEGLVLLDGPARERKPDAIEYGARVHAARADGPDYLRVDLVGHPIAPVGPLHISLTPSNDADLDLRPARERFAFDHGRLVGTLVQFDGAHRRFEPHRLELPTDELLAGPWFATASEDGTVAVWTDDADAPVTRYRGHHAPVRAVAIRGRRVVSGGDDGTVRMWSAEDGHDLAVLGVAAPVTAVAIRFDLKVVWGAADGSLGLWDPEDPANSERIAGHDGRVLGLDPDGVDVISWASDGSVRLWTDDSIVFRGPAPARRALAREDGVLVLWGDETVTREHPGDASPTLAVSRTGQQVAFGSGTELVVSTRGVLERRRQDAPVLAVAYASDGPYTVTAMDTPLCIAALDDDVAYGESDGSISFRKRSSIETGASAVVSLASDGNALASGHENGAVKTWPDGATVFLQSGPARHVAIAGATIASADGDEIRLPDGTLSHGAPLTGLAFIDGGRLASSAQDGTLHVWDLTRREIVETFRSPAPLVALAAGGQTLAARDSTGRLYVWDVGPGTEVLHDYSSGDRLRFEHDVEVLAIEAERVAIDQPPGFWDELDDEGRFIVPPLIPAGRTVEAARIAQIST